MDSLLKHLNAYAMGWLPIPWFNQIAQELWISKSTVHKRVQELSKQGYVTKEWIRFIATDKLSWLPYFESVSAWFPSPAQDDTRFNLNLNSYLVEHPFSTYIVKVTGDSMKDAFITQGDLVIVDRSKQQKQWDIIIANVDWDFTLKYYFKEDWVVFLRAANDAYPDIHPTGELEVCGVIIWVVRKVC